MTYHYDSASKLVQFSIPGDLLSTKADQFRAMALALVEAHSSGFPEWAGVEINLERAHMVDSAGLNALIGLLRMLKKDERRMIIRVANPQAKRVSLFTRTDRQAEIIHA